MAFESQNKFEMLFVDWEELGEDHEPETNIVVKEGQGIRGVVKKVSTEAADGSFKGLLLSNAMTVKHEKGKKPKEYPKIADYDKPVYVKKNASLDRQVMNDDADDFIPVKEGDEVIIMFTGTYPTKGGNKGYGMNVLVDRK